MNSKEQSHNVKQHIGNMQKKQKLSGSKSGKTTAHGSGHLLMGTSTMITALAAAFIITAPNDAFAQAWSANGSPVNVNLPTDVTYTLPPVSSTAGSGLSASGGGVLTVTGAGKITINTSGGGTTGNDGIVALGNQSKVDVSNEVIISTMGPNGRGLSADNGGVINLHGKTSISIGDPGAGAIEAGLDGQITADGEVNITTNGYGISPQNGGQVKLLGGGKIEGVNGNHTLLSMTGFSSGGNAQGRSPTSFKGNNLDFIVRAGSSSSLDGGRDSAVIQAGLDKLSSSVRGPVILELTGGSITAPSFSGALHVEGGSTATLTGVTVTSTDDDLHGTDSVITVGSELSFGDLGFSHLILNTSTVTKETAGEAGVRAEFGAIADINDSTIEVKAGGAGVSVASSSFSASLAATANITNSKIIATKQANSTQLVNGVGLLADGRYSTITAGNSTVTADSDGVRLTNRSIANIQNGTSITSGDAGVRASSGSTASITDSTIAGVSGLVGDGTNTSITADHSAVTSTTGNGVSLTNRATAHIQNGTTITTTNGGAGVVANALTTATIADSAVTTMAGGIGLLANGTGTITADRSTVTTNGADSAGLGVNSGGTITFNDGMVTTNAATSHGITTQAGGTVNVNNSMLAAGGDGIRVIDGASTVNLTGSTLTNGSGVAYNVQPGATATLVADSSTLTGTMLTDASSTSDVTLQNGTVWNITGDSNVSTLSLDAATVHYNALASIATTANAINLLSGGGVFDTNGLNPVISTVIQGAGGLTKTGAGALILSAANTYAGDTAVDAGTLRAGAENTFSPNSAVTVAAAGTLDLAGLNQNIAGLTNAGLVSFGTSTPPGTVLTVNGNILGQGGALSYNTVLGADDSATDKLVINGGAATGTTKLIINKAGGPGAVTAGNGIELIQVENGATSTPTAFVLNNRVVAGAYEYDLYQGGIGADVNDGNWYLRSMILPNGSASTQGVPAVRPEIGAYLRNLTIASGMFTHTLHDRLGEPQFTDQYRAATNGKVSSVWVRVAGNHADGSAADGEINLSTDTTLVHFGGDLARWSSNGQNRWQFGLMGAYGESDTDADPEHLQKANNGTRRAASGKVDGYGVGAYLTWYGNKDKPNGPYVDLWSMYGWYNNKVKGNTLPEESYDSNGWTLSAEGGYAFVVKDSETRQWIVEPQAQLLYTSFSEDSHREQGGTQVSDGNWNGVTSRLGVRAYTHSKLDGNSVQPFVEANWWHGSAQNSLSFDGVQISDDTPKDTFELKAGAEAQIARHWQVWGHFGWRQGGNDYSAYEGMVGAKFQF